MSGYVGFTEIGSGRGGSVPKKLEKEETSYYLKIIQFSVKIADNILRLNFFDPKLTQPKLFQTERTRRLACLSSFCSLASLITMMIKLR